MTDTLSESPFVHGSRQFMVVPRYCRIFLTYNLVTVWPEIITFPSSSMEQRNESSALRFPSNISRKSLTNAGTSGLFMRSLSKINRSWEEEIDSSFSGLFRMILCCVGRSDVTVFANCCWSWAPTKLRSCSGSRYTSAPFWNKRFDPKLSGE